MWDIKETSPNGDLRHGHTVVGQTARPLATDAAKFNRGILIRAPGAGDLVPNTDIVWIGRKAVTADYNVGTGGMPLLPGAAVELPVEDPSQVFVISGTDNQDVAWVGA